MSPSPGDGNSPPPPEPSNKATGALASVFKGLTGSKQLKPYPATLAPTWASSATSANYLPGSTSESDLAPPQKPKGAGVLAPSQTAHLEQLKHGKSAERIAAADALRYCIPDYPFNPVLEIWYSGKDLIEQDKPNNVRVAGWGLLRECAKHAGSTDLERKEYFDTLTAPASPDDFHLQLEALMDLTKRGRDLSGFDYDIFPLMTTWLNETFKAVIKARKQRTARSARGNSAPAGEDTNFSQLFLFLLELIKFSFKVADDRTIATLIKTLREICNAANVEEDLVSCINAINAIVTYGKIPSKSLPDALNILSAIFALVPNRKKEAWHALANLYKSHHGEEAVQVLLRVVHQFPSEGRDPKESAREVRSALAALGKLVTKTTAKGYPQVPLCQLVDGLANVSSRSTSPRLLGGVLEVINCLFDVGDRQLNSMIVDEDWSPILDIAATCTGKLIDLQTQNGSGLQRHASTATSRDDGEKREMDAHQELKTLSARIEQLLGEKRPDLAQRQACIAFFVKNHRTLSDAAVDLVVDHFKKFGGCSPSDSLWEQNLGLVLSFYTDPNRSTLVRLHALQLLELVFVVLEVAYDILGGDLVPTLIKQLLNGIAEETDTLLLQDTVTFMVSVAASATSTDLFELITSRLKSVIVNGRSRKNAVSDLIQPSGTTPKGEHAGYCANQSPSNVVTRGYVQIFMRTVHTNASKATKAFTALVNIARSNQCETDARLTAMKLLFRLRADWFGHIYITSVTESEGLAGVLYRTESSLARKLAEDAAQPSRPTRAEQGLTSRPARVASFGPGQPNERSFAARMAGGSGGPASTEVKYQQLWSLPDTDALPEAPVPSSSKLLLSSEPRGCATTGVETSNSAKKCADSKNSAGCSDQTMILNMASWLETICNLFLTGSDWEVYSFVLVHLPDQLSNHALFRGATSQIQDIRKLLCDQIKSNDFREPPSSAGPRRPEVLSCLYQTLTMMLSHHHHFQKPDEDDLVRTFIHGLTDKTAVICIHAITICCHEVPMSISKSLVTILQGMSRVITRQGVAMHILEFLAGLSHLTDLYSNFRDDEYRIVFGICFRYLQTVRDNNRRNSQRAASTGNEPLPLLPVPGSSADGPSAYSNATEELPEYVYALAYHVIIFWFLALKVPDRASHVGWIASRLFTDNDGKQITDEQAQVTLDFMQRVAFTASDESIEDPMLKGMNPTELAEKTWLVGDSIITVQQVINSGLAQVIRRQPSGTSFFTIQQNFAPRPAHQVYNRSDATDGMVTLPSNLLVRLLSSTPQAWDSVHRPIPLTAGEDLERIIRNFDRNPPVDGHKVGVIYVGENQTEETDILANVSGSEDYNTFLASLGSMVTLKGATFNTQGLDREFNSDGEYAVCWRDRVAEIVFHVTTLMPTNLEHDPQCIGKKRHIGNDFVNIIFNDSGAPFKFDTFPSQFNYLNIVITPESHVSFVETHEVSWPPSSGASPSPSPTPAKEGKTPLPCFYKVQVITKPGFPEISPAAETKIVSLQALPHFVRLLALNASVFCLVWAGHERGQVHISPWRNRLREITRLRERFGPKLPPTSPSSAGGPTTMASQQFPPAQQQQQPPALQVQHAPEPSAAAASSRPASSVRDSFNSLRRSSVATFFTTASEQTSHRSSVLSNATTDQTEVQPMAGMDSVVDSLDFSKWA